MAGTCFEFLDYHRTESAHSDHSDSYWTFDSLTVNEKTKMYPTFEDPLIPSAYIVLRISI